MSENEPDQSVEDSQRTLTSPNEELLNEDLEDLKSLGELKISAQEDETSEKSNDEVFKIWIIYFILKLSFYFGHLG